MHGDLAKSMKTIPKTVGEKKERIKQKGREMEGGGARKGQRERESEREK